MSRIGPTLLALAIAGVLTLAAYTDPVLVAAVVVLVQILIATAPSPVSATGRVIRSPHFAAVFGAGLVATAVTLVPDLLSGADGTSQDVVGTTDSGMLAGILPAIAVGLFIALIAQMLRKDGRTDLVQSTAYAVTLSVLAALSVGWIGAAQSLGEAECVAVGAAGLAAGLLVWMLPLDRFVCLGLAMVAGAGAGVVVVLIVDADLKVLFGVLIGGATALFAVLGQVMARATTGRDSHPASVWGFPGAMSIALAAPIVYLGGQLVSAGL